MTATRSAEEFVRPVAETIRGLAAQAEAERRLPGELFSRLVEAGLFSIYTPKEFGGLELSMPEALRVVEEVARHDGSTGWTVALGFANGAFTPALSRASAARVLGTGSALIAGAPAFGVRASRVDGGYRLTGRWRFNSGAPNANWIATAAAIFDGDAPRPGKGGQPEMVLVFMPPSDVQIIDTWYVTGLRATGTQDLYVEGAFVADELTGEFAMPAGPRAVRESPYAKVPFFSLLGLAQSPPVCLGLARRAVEEFTALALQKESMFGPKLKEQAQAQAGLARAEALVQSARCYWYERVEAFWAAAAGRHGPQISDRVSVRTASLNVAENCVAAVDLLYRLAGTSAIFQSSPLERCWRDVHTAAQHVQMQPGRWETAGKAMLGLDPGASIL
jgi:alkylation response protein AidB-like acyl-CoA dehydrogenase